jgi:hypothetical protein
MDDTVPRTYRFSFTVPDIDKAQADEIAEFVQLSGASPVEVQGFETKEEQLLSAQRRRARYERERAGVQDTIEDLENEYEDSKAYDPIKRNTVAVGVFKKALKLRGTAPDGERAEALCVKIGAEMFNLTAEQSVHLHT